MKTIKIYLNNSGAVSSFDAPNWVNQFSYNDTLINIYVPNEILETQTDTETTTYSNGVTMSMLYTQSNGTYSLGNSYNFVYVKNDVLYNGITYTLFERKMPKEFTLYSGVQEFGISIVAYQSVTENNVTTTSVIGNITSNLFEMTINSALDIVDNPTEVDDDLSTLIANVNSLLTDMPLKQNKEDNIITVKIANGSNTTTDVVNLALNYLDARVSSIYTTTTTLDNDLTNLTSRVSTLENQTITGFRFVGTITATDTEPDATSLTNFVLLNYTSVQNGDTVIWVDEVTSGTDRAFKCIYSTSWSWYEIPQVELATDNEAGLVQGGISADCLAYVNIASGKIYDIKYKNADNTYSSITEIGTNKSNIADIIAGNTYVGKSSYALYDESESNNVNPTPIANKYLTVSSGATKQYVKDYSLPKQFNDLYILDLDTDTFSTDILTTAKTKSVVVSTIGTTLLESATLSTGIYEYQLSNKNGYNFVSRITSDTDIANVSFIVTITYDGNIIGSYETEYYSLTAGNYYTIRILDWFNEITSPIDVTANTTFTINFYVYQREATNVTYTIRTSQSSPTVLSLSTNYYTISASIRGIDEHFAIGVYDSVNKILTFELGNISIVDKTQHFLGLTLPVGETILSIPNDTSISITIDGVDVPLSIKGSNNIILADLSIFYNGINDTILFYALYDSVNFNGFLIPNVDIAETTYRIPPNEITALGDDYALNYNVISTLYDRKLIIDGNNIGLTDIVLILTPNKYIQHTLTEYEFIYDAISADSGAIYYNAISIKTNTISQTSILYISNVELASKSYVDTELALKQDTLTFDNTPTASSTNPVTSDGIKSYVDTAEANAKTYCDNSIASLKWQLGAFDYEDETDTDVALTSSVPSGTISARLESIGGMSYKYNQLVQNGNFVDTTSWNGSSTTLSVNNNIATITATVNSQYCGLTKQNVSLKQGHKYFISYNFNPSGNFKTCIYNGDGVQGQTNTTANINNKINIIFTQNNDFSYILIYLNYSGAVIGDYAKITDVQLFDLTDKGIDTSDVSVATSELLKRGIDINEYQAYDSGSIRNSAVSSVVASGTGMTDITQDIPAEIQALTGYGWGISSSVRNYISFDKDTNKWYYNQMVGSVDMGSLDWSYSNNLFIASLDTLRGYPFICSLYVFAGDVGVGSIQNMEGITRDNYIYLKNDSYTSSSDFKTAMSGTYLYYELATPVQTDITSLMTSITNPFQLTDDYSTITYTNTYNNAIPYSITYLKEVAK